MEGDVELRGEWEALRGVVAAEELEGSTYSRGRAREGGARWHAACRCADEGAGAAKAHGEAREGDEGDQDERQRVTETRKACGRTEEEDIGKEDDDAQERTIPVVGIALRRRKRRGAVVQREDDDEGGGYWTLMARPEAVGAVMPTTTVARPPFWLVTRVVTTGMARSGVLTDVNSCLPRSPSSVECYHGERSGRDKWR